MYSITTTSIIVLKVNATNHIYLFERVTSLYELHVLNQLQYVDNKYEMFDALTSHPQKHLVTCLLIS